MVNGENVSDDNDEYIDVEDDGGEDAPFEGKGKGKGKGKAKARATEIAKAGSKRRREPSSCPGGDAMDVRKLLKVSDTIRIGYDEDNHEATVKVGFQSWIGDWVGETNEEEGRGRGKGNGWQRLPG